MIESTLDPEMQLTEASSTEIRNLSGGIIKDPFTFDSVLHEECPTAPQVSDEQRKTVERFWRDAYLKSLSKVVSHVEDWFTKLSFTNKVKFTGSVIVLIADSKKLFDLAYFLGPPTKDYVYAQAQFTRSPYDVAAVDHNRAIDDSSYDTQSLVYIDWFQSLNPREQFEAVVGLIYLGGAALEQTTYSKVAKILEEKERDVVRKRVLQYLAHKREMGAKFVASKVARNKQKLHHSPVRNTTQKPPIVTQQSKSLTGEDEVDYMALLQEKIAEYDNAIKTMEHVAETRIDSKPKKDRGHKKNKSNKSGDKRLNRLNAGIDRIQMLPLWDNRRIMVMLPERSIESTAKVNKYWKDMVDKTKKEVKVRRKLNKFLTKYSSTAEKQGHKEDNREHKLTKKTNYSSGTSIRPKDEDILPEDFHPHLDVYQVFSDDPPKLKPFSNTQETYVICNVFCEDRAMDANKRWAAYSKKTDIELCNIVFGVPCNLKLEHAHSFRISCICFHPNELALVFTGGFDGKVKLHDLWKKNTKMVYAGHKGIVSDVVVNCRYVASCGMDKTVRVYNMADGRSLMCVTLEKLSPSKLLMTNCAHPLLYVATTNGEIVLYSIRDSGHPKRIGKLDNIFVYSRGDVKVL